MMNTCSWMATNKQMCSHHLGSNKGALSLPCSFQFIWTILTVWLKECRVRSLVFPTSWSHIFVCWWPLSSQIIISMCRPCLATWRWEPMLQGNHWLSTHWNRRWFAWTPGLTINRQFTLKAPISLTQILGVSSFKYLGAVCDKAFKLECCSWCSSETVHGWHFLTQKSSGPPPCQLLYAQIWLLNTY